MGARSRIDQLPEEQQARIAALFADKSLTLDDIRAKLQEEMGEDAPSRSALGRKRLEVEQVAGLMRSSREAVKQLRADLGDLSDDEQSRLNYEMLQEQIFRLQMAAMSNDEEQQISVKDLRGLSDAVYRLAASRKLDADRVTKIKAEAREQAAREVKQKIDGIAADVTASGDAKPDAVAVLKRIREDIYGIFEEPAK